jgi:hypothetical protein
MWPAVIVVMSVAVISYDSGRPTTETGRRCLIVLVSVEVLVGCMMTAAGLLKVMPALMAVAHPLAMSKYMPLLTLSVSLQLL